MVVFFHGDESHGRINPYKSPHQNKETIISVVDICRSLNFFAMLSFFCVVSQQKQFHSMKYHKYHKSLADFGGVVQKTVKVNIFKAARPKGAGFWSISLKIIIPPPLQKNKKIRLALTDTKIPQASSG